MDDLSDLGDWEDDAPAAFAGVPSPAAASGFTVTSPTGAELEVPTAADKASYEKRRDDYISVYEIEDPSDLAGLEILLSQELLLGQLQRQMNRGRLDSGATLRPQDMARFVSQSNQLSVRVLQQKKVLGLDLDSRKTERAENPGNYISTLLIRAKEFGVRREDELVRAIDLWKQLQGLVERFDRSNAKERDVVGFRTEADIVEWIRQQFPEFDSIDEAFRQRQARTIGEL